ncbi:MAG: sigma 54-interacting transcriptional regulator [Planctomycetota bacterium]
MPRLVVIEGPNRGAVHSLLPERSRLGRDPQNEVVVLSDRVSRLHAELEVGAEVTLHDRGSRNGTWVNGVRCEAPVTLRPGDELQLAEVRFVFVDDDAPAPGALVGRSTLRLPLGGDEAAGEGAWPVPPSPRYLLGESAVMRVLSRQLATAARAEAPVLLQGESGTGKELAASAIHGLSPRRGGPFVVVNAATLRGDLLSSELFGHEKGAFTGALARRKGAFELADGGTLFLDEVAELPLESQATLLRVVEGKGFRRVGGGSELRPSVRLVAATHQDLRAAADDGRFRQDLYYRLAVVEVTLPPLRERRGDALVLASRFLAELSGGRLRGFEPEAAAALEAYAFPGNVRELRNAVEHAAIFAQGEQVALVDLPQRLQGSAPAPLGADGAFPTLREVEAAHVARALSEAEGNKTLAAKLLGIDRATLYARLKRDGGEG